VALHPQADTADEDRRLCARIDDATVSDLGVGEFKLPAVDTLLWAMMQQQQPGRWSAEAEEWVCTPKATPAAKMDDCV